MIATMPKGTKGAKAWFEEETLPGTVKCSDCGSDTQQKKCNVNKVQTGSGTFTDPELWTFRCVVSQLEYPLYKQPLCDNCRTARANKQRIVFT